MQINLFQLITAKLESLTEEEAEKYFKFGAATVRKLKAGNYTPDYRAAQRVLDEYLSANPGALADVVPGQVFANPPQGSEKTKPEPEEKPHPVTIKDLPPPEPPKPIAKSPYALCMPTNRDINATVMLSILGNWKTSMPPEHRAMLARFHMEKDTLIHHARNSVAQRFLEDGAEWSIWFDSDIIASIGNASWFRKKTGAKLIADKFLCESALERLTRHGKSFVGGVYVERNGSGKLLIPPGRDENDVEGMNLAKSLKSEGPQEKLVPVDWLAFGLVAVHRKVFLDIMQKCPELAPKVEGGPWAFFTPYDGGPHGEDVTFARHAAKAGHQAFLDCGCFAAHVGQHAYLPCA